MDFELRALDLAKAANHACDALVVLVSEGFSSAGDALSTWAVNAQRAGDWSAEAGKRLSGYSVPGVLARHVVCAGIGNGSAKQVARAVEGAASVLTAEGVKSALVVFAQAPSPAAMGAAVRALGQVSYRYTHTKPSAKPVALTQALVAAPVVNEALQAACQKALAYVEGISLAREWGNRPANYATPKRLAEAAKALGKLPKVHCKVLGPDEVEKLGMGAFMAVAQGSREPLRFIELRYNGGKKNDAPVVLVGKGVMFDTGGISLKPAAEMDEMKFDMCGAASVLGVFRALADLRWPINVVGLVPACENMPDGGAIKPGDVVTSMSGQTIEILNTDAEGRLILCDALSYAERFAPRTVIDIATLTGACMVALGGVRSGMFATDDALADALLQAGERANDLCWRLPLDEEYAEGLKSNFADMGNVAGRAGGAITAAKFLQKFVGQWPWAHLDIAGTAWKSGAAKGSVGRPVGLLLEYLASLVPDAQTIDSAEAPAAAAASAESAPAKSRRTRSASAENAPAPAVKTVARTRAPAQAAATPARRRKRNAAEAAQPAGAVQEAPAAAPLAAAETGPAGVERPRTRRA